MPSKNYLIRDLRNEVPEEGKVYLLDANVWYFILRPPGTLEPYEQSYVDFVDAIVTLASNPRCKKKPLIYVNGLILSEVYNAFMRENFKIYNENSPDDIRIKQYRKTADFKKNLSSIKSDFEAYKDYLIIEKDLIADPLDILLALPQDTDYNDSYYYKIALQKELTIITHDGDFIYEDVNISTTNRTLLNLKLS